MKNKRSSKAWKKYDDTHKELVSLKMKYAKAAMKILDKNYIRWKPEDRMTMLALADCHLEVTLELCRLDFKKGK